MADDNITETEATKLIQEALKKASAEILARVSITGPRVQVVGPGKFIIN